MNAPTQALRFASLPKTRSAQISLPAQVPEESVGSADFSRIVESHLPAVYRFALGLCGESSCAKSLAQQAFSSWRECDNSACAVARVRHQLLAIVYTQFLRSNPRNRVMALETISESGGVLDHELERDDLTDLGPDQVVAAFHEVEPVLRAPLLLFYIEGLSSNEICDILDLSARTFLMRVSHGKARLREALHTLIACQHVARITP
jgi:DNA-directed RNA polymerase specialized sigma24 family protein